MNSSSYIYTAHVTIKPDRKINIDALKLDLYLDDITITPGTDNREIYMKITLEDDDNITMLRLFCQIIRQSIGDENLVEIIGNVRGANTTADLLLKGKREECLVFDGSMEEILKASVLREEDLNYWRMKYLMGEYAPDEDFDPRYESDTDYGDLNNLIRFVSIGDTRRDQIVERNQARAQHQLALSNGTSKMYCILTSFPQTRHINNLTQILTTAILL